MWYRRNVPIYLRVHLKSRQLDAQFATLQALVEWLRVAVRVSEGIKVRKCKKKNVRHVTLYSRYFAFL